MSRSKSGLGRGVLRSRGEWFLVAGFLFCEGPTVLYHSADTVVGAVVLVVLGLVAGFRGLSAGQGGIRTGVMLAVTLGASALWRFDLGVLDTTLLLLLIIVAALASRAVVGWLAVAASTGLALAGTARFFVFGESGIDVFAVLQKASFDIAHGINPYADTYPGLVIPATPTAPYTIHTNLDYGPAIPLELTPLRWLGDTRITQLLSLVIIVVLIAVAAYRAGMPERRLRLLTILLLASPISLIMVRDSCVETLSMLPLIGWWWLRSRGAKAGGLLGLVLAGKYTLMGILLPAAVRRIGTLRAVFVGCGVATVVALPFALVTGPAQFYYDLVGFLSSPATSGPQYSSVTVDSILLHWGLGALPSWVGPLVTVVVVTGACGWIARSRDETGLHALGAFISVVVLLAAPFAHFNYFWGPAIWMILLAVTDQTNGDANSSLGRATLLPVTAPTGRPATIAHGVCPRYLK